MPSSLEELLWDEGFKGKRSTERPRHSTSLENTGPLHPPRRSLSHQGEKVRTERTRSVISRFKSELGASGSDRARQARPRDEFRRGEGRVGGSLLRETLTGGDEESGPGELYKRKELVVEGKRDSSTSEIVEVEEEEENMNSKFKDIYLNEVYSSDSRRSSSSDKRALEGYINGSPKDIKLEKWRSLHYSKSLLGQTSSINNDQEKTNENFMPSITSKRSVLNRKSSNSKRSEKRENSTSGASEFALDQVAIQAVISIIGGHIKPFLHDENFRNSLRVNCFTSLSVNKIDGFRGYSSDNKVISNLEEAIEIVEHAVAKGEITRDLKKASLQLSVITGLSSNDMKDAFTAEIPNFKLSACAHVYLSVIYKLQKKEKLSARHILQVFCTSPFQARNLLLPDLWEILFFPHLSHLQKWYTDEADKLGQDLTKSRKLRFLEKVYNDVLDSGTFQFAGYYKNWLAEDTEAPSLPLIHIPAIPVRGSVKEKGSSSNSSSELASSPSGPFSPKPMVSKRLYEAVFNNGKHGPNEQLQQKANYSPDNYSRNYCRSRFEENQTVTNAVEEIKYADCPVMKISSSGNKVGNSSQQAGHLIVRKDLWKQKEVLVQEDGSPEDEAINVPQWNGSSENSQQSQAPCVKENEGIIRGLAIAVFKKQNLPVEALENSEYLGKDSFYADAPLDFICPLTARLFSDPVTLETGQTFERAAITEWLQGGNKMCPVTEKTLECTSVPLTNFILKRIVDNWKLDQLDYPEIRDSQKSCHTRDDRDLEDQSALCTLEPLLTGLSKEEKIKNANSLISLGGLEFLLQQFEHGNLEKVVTVALILLLCMEADPECRLQIAREINKQQLFNLLHGKPEIARKYGVPLLVELICSSSVKDVKIFFSGLPTEIPTVFMDILLQYLQSLPLDQKPLIAILILHFDLVLEPQKYSIYREEAVDAISMAMDSSLTDGSVRTSCCRALYILGGYTSGSTTLHHGRKSLEEVERKFSSLLEANEGVEGVSQDKSIFLDLEEQTKNGWLRNVAISLLGSGRISFVDMLSKCLGSRFPELVKACLTIVVWLSIALASLPDAEVHLSTFSALISQLKDNLDKSEPLEYRVLASESLHNFSKFPECRVLLMTIADDIYVPLRELSKTTWTARELYNDLYRNELALRKEQLASKIRC